MNSLLLVGVVLLVRTVADNRPQTARAEDTLTLNVFNNTAFAGKPSVQVLPGLNFSLSASHPFSAEVIGTLVANEGERYSFTCDFGSVRLAYLHVDDHMLCQTGTNSGIGQVAGRKEENPLPTMSRKNLPLRLAVVHDGNSAGPTVRIGVTVSVSTTAAATVPCPTSGWEENSDYPGNDLAKVENVPTKEDCCALCTQKVGCAAVSWDSPASKWKTKTCNMKSAVGTKQASPGLWAMIMSPPAPGRPVKYTPALPAPEVQRRKMQQPPAVHQAQLASDILDFDDIGSGESRQIKPHEISRHPKLPGNS